MGFDVKGLFSLSGSNSKDWGGNFFQTYFPACCTLVEYLKAKNFPRFVPRAREWRSQFGKTWIQRTNLAYNVNVASQLQTGHASDFVLIATVMLISRFRLSSLKIFQGISEDSEVLKDFRWEPNNKFVGELNNLQSIKWIFYEFLKGPRQTPRGGFWKCPIYRCCYHWWNIIGYPMVM